MPKIEVMVRYLGEKPEALKQKEFEEEQQAELTGQRYQPSEFFVFKKKTLDIKDIKEFNESDRLLVSVITYGGQSFNMKADYEQFKMIYEDIIGETIKTIMMEEDIPKETHQIDLWTKNN